MSFVGCRYVRLKEGEDVSGQGATAPYGVASDGVYGEKQAEGEEKKQTKGVCMRRFRLSWAVDVQRKTF